MHKTSIKTEAALSSAELNEAWDRISEDVAKAFRMPEEEKERFKNKEIAKLIAAIPLLAGCEDAERTAVSHLGTYILSVRETKPYFNAQTRDNESIFERLRLISNFKGGNRQIIQKGMSLIALTMLNDYKRDIHIDDVLGKYNPVGDSAFDYESLKADLQQKIDAVTCPEMDKVFTDMGTQDYWGIT